MDALINKSVSYPMQLIKKHLVRPSSCSSIPNDEPLKISLFDQIAPPCYIPAIFFYEKRGLSTDVKDISQKLRESLSFILASFYPLTGNFDQDKNLIVNCYENGVEVIETRVNARLSDVVGDPNIEEVIKEYLPLDPVRFGSEALLLVQINFFDCGGFAVGICFSHKIGDGTSMFDFMNAWAVACRGDQQQRPIDNYMGLVARRFPAVDFTESSHTLAVNKERVFKTKRFVFDKEKLTALRDCCNNNTTTTTNKVVNPTRVELVSAFVWKHLKMSIAVKEKKKAHVAIHAVNLRPRTNLFQVEHRNVFGNYYTIAVALGGDVSEHQTMDELLFKLRNAIRSVDIDGCLRHAEMGDLSYMLRGLDLLADEDKEVFAFTSWCRFPVYEVDFGWGKPILFCPLTMPVNNITFLVDTKCGEGIEAWVNVSRYEELEDLQTNFKLLGN